MKNILATLLTLTIFLSTAQGQEKAEENTRNKVNNYLSELGKVGFSGSVLVGMEGELLVSKGFGFSNAEKKINNTPSTVFDIGSITKQFTAAAIMKLEMEGTISTSDLITSYFNNVPDDKVNITIHDLLRHQSGLVSNVGPDYESISEAEFLKKVFSSTLESEPGSTFSYSNIGYSLLTLIIEKASGMSYEMYLYENLWKPVKMESTGYSRPQFKKDQIAIGYDKENKVWGRPTDKHWDKDAPFLHLKGNGGILSTVEDLFKWYQALISNAVLTEDARKKYLYPELRDEETESSYYAYGWDVSQTSRNTTQVWHNGSNRIFYADFLWYIEENVAIIMLSNKLHPNFLRLNREVSLIIFSNDFDPVIPAEDNETNRNFTTQILNIIEESGLEKAVEAFQNRAPEENLLLFRMSDAGFESLDEKKPEVALQIFEMNFHAYPRSAKALQDLGEGYMETGNTELALKYFKESLSINPESPFVKDMIKKLE